MLIAVVLALATAMSNAAANVMQRMADREEPDQRGLSPRLMWSLLHRKIWLTGLAAVITSFVLQAAALHFGQLALVQPIIVVELPLTLIAAAVVFHSPMAARDWTSVALMTVGLAVLIGSLDPHRGQPGGPDPLAWVMGVGICVTVITALVVAALRRDGLRKAALLGAATGIGFGMTAAFTKAAMIALGSGVGALFGAWPTYALAVSGLGSMFLMQNALRAGKLVAAQPGITLLDPFTAILWGIFAFHEQARHGLAAVAAVGGAVAMVAGAVLLSRSAVLDSASGGATATTPTAR